MERRVEASELRKAGCKARDAVDRGEVVGVVKGCERDAGGDRVTRLRVDAAWPGEEAAAVHDSVWVRADRTVAEDCAFMPFAYVEESANTLTNAIFGPVGKIPVQI